jgi:hypothetical protein
MAPSPKPAPRLGDIPSPSDLCKRTDRLDGISNKLDWLIKSYADLDRRLAVLEGKGKAKR